MSVSRPLVARDVYGHSPWSFRPSTSHISPAATAAVLPFRTFIETFAGRRTVHSASPTDELPSDERGTPTGEDVFCDISRTGWPNVVKLGIHVHHNYLRQTGPKNR